MNPIVNKSDFEDLTTNLKDLAYSYLEKYNPSKQQLKVYLLKKYFIPKIVIIPSLILTYFTGPVGLSIVKKEKK